MNNQINYNHDINKYVSRFTNIYSLDSNGRFLSYDHLRNIFLRYRNDESKKEFLSLHLFAYLGSWGMLRNSFLMHKDYLFSLPVVDILCEDKYNSLLDINQYTRITDNEVNLILDLVNRIRNYYIGKTYYDSKVNEYLEISNVTDTLVSKIILGTFGCIVAYDTYARSALSYLGFNQRINTKSIRQLNEFIIQNESVIRNFQNHLNPTIYTPMKIVDMYLFEKGYDIEESKKNKNNN